MSGPTPNPSLNSGSNKSVSSDNGGQGNPKPSDRIGDEEFKQESDLADSSNTSSEASEGPQEAERADGGGKSRGDRAKDFAASANETAKDVRDVAKAGPTGLETSAQEIKEGKDKHGAKGAATAAGREAAGQTVATGLDVVTAGATAKAHGKIAKGVSKGLKKENLKKIVLGVAVLSAIPAIIIGLLIFILTYAAQNPWKFVEQVLGDPKAREFATQAAGLTAKTISNQDEILKQYGYVDINSGSAIAQQSVAPPKPGSLAEKISKINMKNAIYQTSAKPDCPYTFTYKDMVGPDGRQTSVIDKVYDKKGQEVTSNNFVVYYCIAQSMPLYNLMIRTDIGKNVNEFGGVVLNYAGDPKGLKNKSTEEVKDYVYDKTYNRITSKPEDDPRVDNENVAKYIADVRKALQDGKDPYAVDSDFQFEPGFDTDDKKTVATMCTFAKGYLEPENLRQGIFTRLNTGQRSGMKTNTLSSTRHLEMMSNEELGPTFKQLDGWTGSTAFSQNVYGTQGGEKINPESLSTTSYGAGYQYVLSIMTSTTKECKGLQTGMLKSLLAVFFGGDNEYQERLNNIKREYELLKQAIINQSNGQFTNPDDFGLQQLMIGVIRMSGGSAVSGLEPGPWNFNNQSQGFRSLSNQYLMRMGGRFLDKTEMQQLNALAENTRRDIEEKNGIAYRLFGKDNIRSLANVIQYETPRTLNEANRAGQNYLAKISNPIKLIADLHSSFGYIATGKINRAFAADTTGDAYMRLTTVGIPQSMLNNIDLFKNSDEIQEIQANGTPAQKKALEYFDKCSKSNIPSPELFSKTLLIDKNGEPDPTKPVLKTQILHKGANNETKIQVPYYATMADKFEDQDEISEEKIAFMICEAYLIPSSNWFSEDLIKQLFGDIKFFELAKKYQLYLYANNMVDLMVELSSTERNDNIYANGQSSNTHGSSIDGVECPANLGEANPSRHNYYQLPPNPEVYSVLEENRRNKQYGAKELVCVLYTVGKAYREAYPNSILAVGEMNAAAPHVSHNWGVAVDLWATPTGSAGAGEWAANHIVGGYSTEATIKLGQLFVDTGILQDIWWCDGGDGSIDAISAYASSKGKPINIKCIQGHSDHFHVNISCEFSGPADYPNFSRVPKDTWKKCSKEIKRAVSSSSL